MGDVGGEGGAGDIDPRGVGAALEVDGGAGAQVVADLGVAGVVAFEAVESGAGDGPVGGRDANQVALGSVAGGGLDGIGESAVRRQLESQSGGVGVAEVLGGPWGDQSVVGAAVAQGAVDEDEFGGGAHAHQVIVAYKKCQAR